MEPSVSPIGILIIDDDQASQSALQQVLDTEGWRLSIAPLPGDAMHQLATGDWKLIVANVAMTGLSGPLYGILKELALAPAMENGATRARVLFLVPELAALQAQPVLENHKLPYTLKPFHFHDFLEKVSDLLMETETISAPIRRVRQDGLVSDKRRTDRNTREAAQGLANTRDTGMFARREDCVMTEEEMIEYERQEAEETKRKKKPSPSV